jgi:hypothetical protein
VVGPPAPDAPQPQAQPQPATDGAGARKPPKGTGPHTLILPTTQTEAIIIFRKMSAAEAEKTLESKQLQPKIPGTNGKKYLSESLDKVIVFENKGVAEGTKEVIVEFTLDKTKYDALIADKIHQDAIKDTPGGKLRVEYHYEDLIKNGPLINIGVPENHLAAFNEAVLSVRIVPVKD